MPVSDQLLVLALAIASPGDPKLPLTLNADSVAQPAGGAQARAIDAYDKHQTYGKVSSGVVIKGNAAEQKCASGEHYIKFWRGADATHKTQASKCAPIKYFPKSDYLATGKVFPK